MKGYYTKMDFPDRLEIALRYWILSVMSVFGWFENVNFNKQIKRISDIKSSYDDYNESVRSDESETCAMAQGPYDPNGCDEDSESTGTGEGFEESEPGETSAGESDGGEDDEGGLHAVPDDSLRSGDVVH